jgi:hypothetical protein
MNFEPSEERAIMVERFARLLDVESSPARVRGERTAPESLLKRDGPAAFVNLSCRHAHGGRRYGGTSEIHCGVVAERALKLPRTRA